MSSSEVPQGVKDTIDAWFNENFKPPQGKTINRSVYYSNIKEEKKFYKNLIKELKFEDPELKKDIKNYENEIRERFKKESRGEGAKFTNDREKEIVIKVRNFKINKGLGLFIKNPFKYHCIPYNLAIKLVPHSEINMSEIEIHKEMGELLRRSFAASSNSEYTRNGFGNKPNYEKKIGYETKNKSKYGDLLDEYKLKEVRGEASWYYVPLHIYEQEQFVADFLKTSCWELDYENLKESNISEVITKLGNNPEKTSDKLFRVLKSGISILKGEAGTGKTDAIKTIVDINISYEFPSILCSFTGRAVANLKSRLKRSVNNLVYISTVHALYYRLKNLQKMLKKVFKESSKDFNIKSWLKSLNDCGKQDELPLFRKLAFILSKPFALIIEESSMIDTELVYQLFRKLKNITSCEVFNNKIHLILVGDHNQLPPIGWGQFFISVIKSQKFTDCTLTKNYRTKNLTIIENARTYGREGKHDTPLEKLKHDETFKMINKNEITDFYRKCNSDAYQVISTTNKCRQKINREIQDLLFEGKRPIISIEKKEEKKKFYKGDRVIFNENIINEKIISSEDEKRYISNPSLALHYKREKGIEIYNGTIGRIDGIGYKKLDTCICDKGDCITRENYEDFSKKNCMRKYSFLYKDEQHYREYTPGQYVKHLIVKISDGSLVNVYMMKKSVDDEEDEEVSFKSRKQFPTIENLDLAYCLTTHKSQGGEWEHILYLIGDVWGESFISPGGATNVYTAITRASKYFSHSETEKGYPKPCPDIFNILPEFLNK